MGKEEIEKVKKKIWSFGYGCKDVTVVPSLGYDLLVTNKNTGMEYQVKVVDKNGEFDSVNNKVILALVDGDEISFQICKRGSCREESSPLKAFSHD